MDPGPHAAAPRARVDIAAARQLLDRIERRFLPLQVWLFGSRARGDARDSSDWDFFVVLPDAAPDADLDPLEAWELQKRPGIHADIITCRQSDFEAERHVVNTLSNEVIREGVLVYER